MSSASLVSDGNFADPDVLASAAGHFLADDTSRGNPFKMFAALQKTRPVFQTPNGLWLVTSHDAASRLLRDSRISRWEAARTELGLDDAGEPELREAISANVKMLINRDPPDHTRLRNLVRLAFLPHEILKWKHRIDTTARAIVDKVVGKAEFEFVTEVAFPLPEIVICEMLGVPHSDHALWSKWSHESVAANRTPAPTGENLVRVQNATKSFHNYFKTLIAQRRQNLGSDLISLLLRAEEAGDKLTEEELIGTITLLIQAGHETTANLIANGMYHLMRNPERYAELRSDPSKIPAAVEEMLRLDGPAMFPLPRMAMDDIEIEGATIRKGDRLLICILAADHDPEVFPDPDRMDFSRPNLSKNVAFGVGIHICLGRHLALLEAEVMFREIMARLPRLELAEEPRYAPLYTRGLVSLKVRNRSVA